MAGSTTNLGLIKPLGTEKIRIAQINQNSDTLDAAIGAVGSTSLQAQVGAIEDGIAIVANGDSHVAITAGQFVYVKNNTHNLAEGLYVASANVSANGSITSSNMTADASGGLNALNAKIETHDFGSHTISDIQIAMVTYAGNLSNNETRNIAFAVNAISSPFVVTTYVGTLTRVSATRIAVNVYQSMNTACAIFGKYKDGTWEWNESALKSEKLDNSNSNHTISLVGSTDFVGFDIRPTGASNFFRLNFFDNGKVSISRYAGGAWQTEVTLRNAD